MPYQALVLLVCSGNQCRSPMAEHLLRRMIARRGDGDRMRVSSAGTWCDLDQPATLLAQAALRAVGLDLSTHRSRPVTQQLVDDADLILVMTRAHLSDVVARFGRVEFKIHLLSEMVGKRYDVLDPYQGTAPEYEACRDELTDLLERGYDRIVSLAVGH